MTANLLDEYSVKKEIANINPHTILHLAAICGGIQYNIKYPKEMLSGNINMAINVFEAARISGVKRVITIGSTCAYPADIRSPFLTQEYATGFPEVTNSAYGIAKRTLYGIGEVYSKMFGIEHLHIVLANLYGPRDKFGEEESHVIPALIDRFMAKKNVTVWGDGTTKREFLYVEDAAKIIVKLANSDRVGIVNVGSGEVCTIAELVKHIKKLTGNRGKVSWDKSKPMGQKDRLLQSDYKGTTKLCDGLKKTIEWYKAIDK
jgi:GDP-L-fucose synthase